MPLLCSLCVNKVNQNCIVGVKLATQDAQNDTSKLLQFVESARNNGDDAVLINLVDAETAQQCIEAAGDMKVVFVNRAPSDTSVLNDNAKFVGSNEMTCLLYTSLHRKTSFWTSCRTISSMPSIMTRW